MLLVIVVPGLLEAGSSSEKARAPWPEAPYLARLLKLAGEPRVEPDGLFAALAPLYGVARQRDWPLAPLLVEARGIDPGDAYWLHATPVTLVAGRQDVRIAAPAVALDEAEAQALMTRLNQHFAGDGLQFVAPAPNEWFVRLEREPSLSTRPLATVIGKSLRLTGNDGTAAAGADANAPVLSGQSGGGNIITVTANNVRIDGLHLNAAGYRAWRAAIVERVN